MNPELCASDVIDFNPLGDQLRSTTVYHHSLLDREKHYEVVVVEGQATWDSETWQILDFKVTGIADFTAADPYQAMQDLAAAAQGHWEGVDALEYVRELRGADEDEPSSRAQSAP